MLKVPTVVVVVCLDGGGVGRLRPGALGARVLVLGCRGVGGGVLGRRRRSGGLVAAGPSPCWVVSSDVDVVDVAAT